MMMLVASKTEVSPSMTCELNLFIWQELPFTCEVSNTIGFEQPTNTTGQLLNDCILALQHRCNVNLWLADVNAMQLKVMRRFFVFVR